jgi:hypothetical protein
MSRGSRKPIGTKEKKRTFTSDDISADVRDFVARQLIQRRGAKAISKHSNLDTATIRRIENGLPVRLDAFIYALEWANQVDAIDLDWEKAHHEQMSEIELLAEVIKRNWIKTQPFNGMELPSEAIMENLAWFAADTAVKYLTNKAVPNSSYQIAQSGKVIDPVTDLVLPPPPGKPYQERSSMPTGERPDAFEHLQKEYSAYIKAGLLFSGHILEIDKPAYEAALYLARKEVRLKQSNGEQITTADVFLEHGIVAGEHLENPPKHLERQIELINRARALAMAPKARGRRSTIQSEHGRK